MAKSKSTKELITATEGRGCHFCEIGIPIDFAETAKIMTKVCLECVLRWYLGWTMMDWENQHAALADHLGDRLDAAIEKEMADGLKALLTGS